MTANHRFTRRMLIAVDTVGYGRRDDQRQVAARASLDNVLQQAADAAALHRNLWVTEPGGDGELAILPEVEPEPVVVDHYVRHLAAALQRDNRDRQETARLRLRMAVHYGTAISGEHGYTGQGLVAVSRLLDSNPLRQALSSPGINLAVLYSSRVYEEVIANGHTSIAPSSLRRVKVHNKEFTEEAWLWLPEGDGHSLKSGGNVESELAQAPEGSRERQADTAKASLFDARGATISGGINAAYIGSIVDPPKTGSIGGPSPDED